MDLRNAPASFWMNLGEIRSKLDHIAGVPLAPNVAQEFHQLYLAKGVHSTTAIEGNTLSEEEIRKHMQGELRLPASQAYLQQEIENIITACNFISRELWEGKGRDLTFETLLHFNRLVLNKLVLQTGEPPGQIRLSSVGVGNYLGAPAGECEYLLKRLCEWLSGPDFEVPGPDETVSAVLKAILAHLYLAWIHPFPDGNGRTARLMEFQILTAAGIASPAAHLLSNHYNKTRREYYRQLDMASRSKGNVLPFLEYAVQGFVDGLKEQVSFIRAFQWETAWRNFVHEQFGHKNEMSPSELRQHHLVLDLSNCEKPVPVEKVNEISPRLALAYAKKSSKTLRRDINKLKKLELVLETKDGVRPNRERILAFIPMRWRSKGDEGSPTGQ